MEKTNLEKTLEMVRKAVKQTKIVEMEGNTGYSFFEGKTRLCKVLKTKKQITIEINVDLDAETEKLFNLNKISRITAHKKHLGTMKYMAKLNDIKNLNKLVQNMVKSFEIQKAKEKAENE